jgi:hypothetical protein
MRHLRASLSAALLALAWAAPPAGAQYYPGYYPYGYGYGYSPAYGYMAGSASLVDAYGGLQIQTEQSRLIGEQANQAELDTKKKKFDLAKYERENTPTYTENQANIEAWRIRRLLNQPTEAEITNGTALNSLLPYLQSLMNQGAAGPPVPLYPPIIKAINVTVGNSGNNAGMLSNGGKLTWPFVLRGPAQKELDAILPKAVAAATDGTLDVAQYNEVTKGMEAVRKELFDKFAREEIVGGDYLQGKRFLESLNSAVQVLKQPTAARYFDGTYKASGSTVQELIQNMTTKGLKFAAASPGNESAYFSLYSSVQAFAMAGHPPESGFRVRLGTASKDGPIAKQ